MPSITSYLSQLPHHPIFTLPSSPSPSSPPSSSSRKRVLLRGSDLILAVGSELRLCSLADSKARWESPDAAAAAAEAGGDVGWYKVLKTAISWDITQLKLDTTGKLLAVVGESQVAVVVLPRKGWNTLALGNSIECRSLSVGRYYHSLPGSPRVSSVLWHPWGTDSSSLVVLTADALVREYAIADDTEEPTQTLSFISSSPTSGATPSGRTRRGFSADDEEGEVAVGMTLGGGAGWGPLTLLGLMRNGDVRALCPFLPSKAAVPASYIHHLSAYVAAKIEATPPATAQQTNGDDSSALTPFNRSSALSTPTRSVSFSRSPASRARPQQSSSSSGLPTNSALQLAYVASLVRQATAEPATPLLAEEGAAVEDYDDPDRLVRLTGPSLNRAGAVAPQGPFLLQPPPPELDNGAESSATDILYLSYDHAESVEDAPGAGGNGEPLGVVALAFADGRVDLCLEVERAEGRWVASGQQDQIEQMPALAVYESLDLGVAQGLKSAEVESALSQLGATLSCDPLYPDTLYVHHSRGAHCLMLAGWLGPVATAMGGGSETEVERALRAAKPTEVVWVLKTAGAGSTDGEAAPAVIGLEVVHDVYLGYSLLLVTSALQCAGLDLALRVDPDAVALPTAPQPGVPAAPSSKKSEGAYESLLSAPFVLPKALAAPTKGSTLAKVPPALSGKELTVTPDSLRFLGQTVEAFRGQLRDLAGAADDVQHRLELVLTELGRQLKELERLSKQGDELREGGVQVAERLERVSNTQAELLHRADRVLQRLMDAHQPTISAHETKWFAELKRLDKTVVGSAEMSLQRRAERLEAQVEQLRPALLEMKRREKEKSGVNGKVEGVKVGVGREGQLGEQQLRLLEGRLKEEARLIVDARRKVDRITGALAATSLN